MPLHPRNLGRKVGLRDASQPCRRRGERTKAAPCNQDRRSRTVPGFLAMERRPWRLRFADLEETLRVEQASKAIRTIEKSACRFSPTFLTNRHARKRPACGLVLFWRCMPENIVSDVEFMRSALAEAREAAERGE